MTTDTERSGRALTIYRPPHHGLTLPEGWTVDADGYLHLPGADGPLTAVGAWIAGKLGRFGMTPIPQWVENRRARR